MSRTYPLEVESVGGDVYIVMSRGHHDLNEFMRTVKADYGDWPMGGAKHMWCKTTPHPEGDRYNFVKEGTRGAWPATYCWEYAGDYKDWQRKEASTDE